MAAKRVDLVIEQGKTFNRKVFWETAPLVWKPITAIGNVAPVLITAAGHGVPDGWRVGICNVLGMLDINSKSTPPKDSELKPATLVGVNQIALNDVSAADFDPYLSGGYVVYWTPMSLTSFTARMTIKDKVGGTALETLVMAALPATGLSIDQTLFTTTINISATDSALLSFGNAVYDLEMVSPTGVVTATLTGSVRLTKEVTT